MSASRYGPATTDTAAGRTPSTLAAGAAADVSAPRQRRASAQCPLRQRMSGGLRLRVAEQFHADAALVEERTVLQCSVEPAPVGLCEKDENVGVAPGTARPSARDPKRCTVRTSGRASTRRQAAAVRQRIAPSRSSQKTLTEP